MLLYKDIVTDPGNGIQPASSTWAKKHIFGWSDDEIKVDLMQQRMERAIGEELKNTPTVIPKTGIFDTLDKLYGTKEGAGAGAPAAPPGEVSEPVGAEFPGLGAELGGESPPPGEEAQPTPEAGGEVTPESINKKEMNILLEKNMFGSKSIDLSIGQQNLGKIAEELDKLLGS